MNAIDLSVVVPVYNGERFLRAALDSIVQQRRPPGCTLEVLVVDDGSQDGSLALAGDYGAPVRCLTGPHAGQCAARNRGARAARGRYLAFLDADDRWLPGKLARQLQLLEQDPSLDAVFAHVRQFLSGRPGATLPSGHDILPGHHPGTLMIRRATFLRLGGFAEDLRAGEFIDWYLRAREQGLREHMLAEALMERRIHEANLGTRRPQDRQDYIRVLKAALDRRRDKERRAEAPTPPDS